MVGFSDFLCFYVCILKRGWGSLFSNILNNYYSEICAFIKNNMDTSANKQAYAKVIVCVTPFHHNAYRSSLKHSWTSHCCK